MNHVISVIFKASSSSEERLRKIFYGSNFRKTRLAAENYCYEKNSDPHRPGEYWVYKPYSPQPDIEKIK